MKNVCEKNIINIDWQTTQSAVSIINVMQIEKYEANRFYILTKILYIKF